MIGPPPQPATEEIVSVVPVPPIPLSEERISSLDLIRGIAILGILPVNMTFYMGPVEGMTPVPPLVQWWGDRFIPALILVVFNAKMITQLAILFGAGLAIQSARADAAERPFAGYYLRRMALLLGLGVAHALLLWYGDILTTYALVGMVALLVRRLSIRALFWCILGFLTFEYLIQAAAIVLTLAFGATTQDQNVEMWGSTLGYYMTAANESRIYQEGPWGEMVVNRAIHFGLAMVVVVVIWAWYLLGSFLLGMVLLRRGVFQDVAGHREYLRKLVLIGLGVGVPIHVVAAVMLFRNPLDPLPMLLNMIGALPQALGYLGLTLFWSQSTFLTGLQSRLKAVGRMALTNYLLQSVLCGFVFYAYGFGLFGKVGPSVGLAVTGLIWFLELAWSPVWLRHFEMGPVEWLWRSLADGRWRPFRREAAV